MQSVGGGVNSGGKRFPSLPLTIKSNALTLHVPRNLHPLFPAYVCVGGRGFRCYYVTVIKRCYSCSALLRAPFLFFLPFLQNADVEVRQPVAPDAEGSVDEILQKL